MNDALRIAIHSPSFLPKCSGAEIFHHNLATRLAAAGHEVSVVLPRRLARSLETQAASFPYQLVPYPANLWSFLKRSPALGLLLNRAALSRLQRRHHFDLWHGVVTYPVGVCLVDWQEHMARRGHPIACLIRPVGDDMLSAANAPVGLRRDLSVNRLLAMHLPKAPLIVALSETMRRECLDAGVPAERITIIPNAVDLERFSTPFDRAATRRKLGLDENHFVFLAVGRNHPQKDYPTLLSAFTRLGARVQHARLVIAGRDVDALRPEIDARGLSNRVKLREVGLPRTPTSRPAAPELPPAELIEIYRAADAFVMCSLLEGFSSALLEAMAASLPVIVTDAPGCGDFVKAGNSGRIVPVSDPAALAAEMTLLSSDPGMRKDLAASSLASAAQFGWPVVVAQYLETYRRLITRTRTDSPKTPRSR